jgi:hypothetical protein
MVIIFTSCDKPAELETVVFIRFYNLIIRLLEAYKIQVTST